MIYSKSRQQITCGIHWPERNITFSTSFVYGTNLRHERVDLWNQLKEMASNSPLRSTPWLVLGDFNQTLLPSEQSRRDEFDIFSEGSRELRDCLSSCALLDLTAQGPIYTWWNHQSINPIAEKLDRMLGNEHWFIQFPRFISIFQEPLFSDHTSCCIRLPMEGPRLTKSFQFNHHLINTIVFSMWFEKHGQTIYQ